MDTTPEGLYVRQKMTRSGRSLTSAKIDQSPVFPHEGVLLGVSGLVGGSD